MHNSPKILLGLHACSHSDFNVALGSGHSNERIETVDSVTGLGQNV